MLRAPTPSPLHVSSCCEYLNLRLDTRLLLSRCIVVTAECCHGCNDACMSCHMCMRALPVHVSAARHCQSASSADAAKICELWTALQFFQHCQLPAGSLPPPAFQHSMPFWFVPTPAHELPSLTSVTLLHCCLRHPSLPTGCLLPPAFRHCPHPNWLFVTCYYHM